MIVGDNGTEFLTRHAALIGDEPRRVALHRSWKTDERHGFVESLNGRFRDECPNETLLRGLAHARQAIEEWRADDDTERPHTSLDGLTPNESARSRADENENEFRL